MVPYFYIINYAQFKALNNNILYQIMSKKIDLNNGNVKNINKKKATLMKKSKGGSKTNNLLKVKKDIPVVEAPKRRGRRPKKIIEDFNNNDNLTETEQSMENNSAVILKLKIDPSKLQKMSKKNKTDTIKTLTPKKSKVSKKINFIVNDDDNNNVKSDEESSEGMFKNDIPDDNICHKCVKNEKALLMIKTKLDKYEKKEKIDKSNKIYSNKLNFISYTNKNKIILKKTNIKCWWDGTSFTNLPCVLPEIFHNNTYHVIGCFCSFNCALAYNLYYLKDSKIHHRKSLVYKLYREMYDLSINEQIDIKEAPPKEILEDYGGDMSIEIFRRSFVHHKEYLVYMPPLKPVNLMIEERNTEAFDNTDKEYLLKRSKPLTKKRSVIASMNINMDETTS